MNESARMVVVLVIVSLLSAASLSIVYEKTKPTIEKNKQIELERSLKEVMPNAQSFKESIWLNDLISEEKEGIKKTFDAYDSENNLFGVILVIDKTGFGGAIKILVGVDKEQATITGVKILDHLETPGLGERITNQAFLDQFKGKSSGLKSEYADAITGATISSETSLENKDIDAITGATISSKAVIDALTSDVNIFSQYIADMLSKKYVKAKDKSLENNTIIESSDEIKENQSLENTENESA